MPYNSAIPQATDKINQSQGQILGNFQEIPLLINVNHLGFGDPDQGKHKFVTYVNQSGAPATAGTDINMYNFLEPVSAAQQLYIKKSAGTAIPFTQSNQSGTQGWSYFASGVKIAWGQDTIPGADATRLVLFSSVPQFPGFTNTPGIMLVRMDDAAVTNFVILDTNTPPTNLQFLARRSPNNTGDDALFSWFAIGA